jgi:hypothetical protein
MNSKQRRTTNRVLNALIGKKAMFIASDGRTLPLVIIGRTVPVIELASVSIDYAFNGQRPSMHRMRCRRENAVTDSTLSPRLAQLRIAV